MSLAKSKSSLVRYELQKTAQAAAYNTEGYEDGSTKSPILDWSGKNVLWLGTSIPSVGVDYDSYPALCAKALGFNLTLASISGSSATYDQADPPTAQTVKSLSMTNDDWVAGYAEFGEGSAYEDYFDGTTVGSQNRIDVLVKDNFEDRAYDCIVLDHNHNDRKAPFGTLSPQTYTISSVSKGSSTTVTAVEHGLSVGDGVALEIEGITNLNHCAARVQEVTTDTFTINVDSSGYSGSFTSGTAIRLDRATLCGGFEFVLHYLYWMITLHGNSGCKIIMCSSPNRYSGENADQSDYAQFEALTANLKKIAAKWGCAFFDVAKHYDIKPGFKTVYFQDETHPITAVSRQALANLWCEWKAGGAVRTLNPDTLLPRGTGPVTTFTHRREALYSKFFSGFATPPVIDADAVSAFTEDFSGDLSSWSTSGTAPEIDTAPWSSSESGVECVSVSTANSAIYKSQSLGQAISVEFDVYFPSVAGPDSGGVQAINLAYIGSGSGPNTSPHYQLRATLRKDGVACQFGLRMFLDSSGTVVDGDYFGPLLEDETKYRLRLEAIRGTETYNGAALLYVDDVLAATVLDQDDHTLSDVAYVALGILYPSNGMETTLWLGNVDFGTIALTDYTERFTGTFETPDSSTVTVVNGIIVSVE